MDFVSNQKLQQQEMLETIGVGSIKELFAAIPRSLFHAGIEGDDGLSEGEVLRLMESLASENNLTRDSYLGAGAYDHHIPALVRAITSRSEFLTSYTPYQPEVSQGLLQAIFEFQTAIAALMAMDVANASVYDGASACAEAVLMALRIKSDRKKVVISAGLHPTYRNVVDLYLNGQDFELIEAPLHDGKTDVSDLLKDAACVLIQSPNFFGVIEPSEMFAKAAQAEEALYIACGNPLAYGLIAPPGQYGADIAVGDVQPFGLSLQFGGPYAGYMACKKEFVRQMPGRIVGQTVDAKGKRGFVLTLQAREQHIRREKATSNICTNQALAALASLVAMLWYGPSGIEKLALTNYQRAHYLSSQLEQLKKFKVIHPHFNEFTLQLPCHVDIALDIFRKAGIEPGLPLNRFFPAMDHHLLVAVTEKKNLAQLNRYVEVARQI